MPINNSEDLIKAFALSKEYKIIKSSAELAFLAQRAYPKNIRYSPPVTKQGVADTVAHFQIIYKKSKATDAKTPLIIIISCLSRYLYKDLSNKKPGYNFDDEDCPTEESLGKSKATTRPLSLESRDEYFYNNNLSRLEDIKGNEITGKKILDLLFNKHIKNTYLIRGFSIRLKDWLKWKLVRICDKIIEFFKSVLINAFDIELISKNFSAGILREYELDDLRKKKAEMLAQPKAELKERIKLFGYPTSKHMVITFSFLVFIFYLTGLRKYIKLIAANALLIVAFTALSLWILENIISKVLIFRLINWIIRIKIRFVFWNFQV